MWNEEVTVDEAIAYLNDLITTDRAAMEKLADKRAHCSLDMAEHPTAQVNFDGTSYYIRLLGVINGMFGIDQEGWGPITFVYEGTKLLYAKRSNE